MYTALKSGSPLLPPSRSQGPRVDFSHIQTNRPDYMKLFFQQQETQSKPTTIYEPPLDSTEVSKVN